MASEQFTFKVLVDGVKAAADGFRQVGKAAQDGLDAAESASGRFGGFFDKLRGGASGLADHVGQKFPQVGKLMESLGGDAEGLGGKIGSMAGVAAVAAPAAAAAVGAAVVKMAGDWAQFAGEVGDFARLSGLSTDSASRLVSVADDVGISVDTLSGAMGKLNKGLGTGALDAWGISAKHAADGSIDMDATMLSVIDSLAKETDETKRAALGTAAFGKSWSDLMPLVEKGASGIKASMAQVSDAQLVSDDDVQAAREYALAMDNMHDAIGDLSKTVGKEALPALAEMTTVMGDNMSTVSSWLQETTGSGLGDFFSGLVKVISPLPNAFHDMTESSRAATPEMLALGEAAHRSGEQMSTTGESAQELRDRLKDEAAAAKEATKAALDQEKALQRLVDAQLAAANSDIAYQQAQYATTEAAVKFREATEKAAESLGKNEAANVAANKAHLDAESAILRQAASASELAKKEAEAEGKTWTARDAAEAQRSELLRLKDQFPDLAAAIDGYIAKLNKIPRNIMTHVQMTANGAVDTATGSRLTEADIVANALAGYADGGLVNAPVGQAVPAIVHGGEYVLTADEVQASKSVGPATKMAFGGGSGGSTFAPVINVQVAAGSSPQQYGAAVVDALAVWCRDNGQLPSAIRTAA